MKAVVIMKLHIKNIIWLSDTLTNDLLNLKEWSYLQYGAVSVEESRHKNGTIYRGRN